VQHDIGDRSSSLMRLPIGSASRKYLRAKLSLMMMTGVEAAESLSENARPLTTGMPMAAK